MPDEQSQELQARLAAIVESSDDAIISQDLEGRITSWNRGAERLYGYSAGEIMGQSVSRLIPDDHTDDFPTILARLRRGERTDHYETVRVAKDGRRVDVSLTISPIRNARGEIIGASKIARDITDRKRAEAALVRSEERLRLITDAMPALISYVDRDLRYRFVNRRYESWLGRRRDEILGHTVAEVVGEAAFEVLRPRLEGVLRGEPIQFEAEVPYRGGPPRWVDAQYVPDFDDTGRMRGFHVFVVEITERKRTEERLRASEESLASELAATNRLHVLSTRLLAADDLATAMDDILANAMATCGATSGLIQLLDPETGGLGIVARRGFGPEFLERFDRVPPDPNSPWGRALGTGERAMIGDVKREPGFESYRAVAAAWGFRAVQSTPLRTHRGVILGLLSTYFRNPRTVSDRDQRLLDLYARHAADLIQRLRYEEALKEADRRKDEFLATLAHELRNPLAPLRNGLQLMRLAPGRPEILEQCSSMMERQLVQMVRLVEDLMDVSRITRGRITLRRERADLAKVIQQAIETSLPLIEAGGHELAVDLPPRPVFVEADLTRLAQVVSNLLNNAARYTERGGRIAVSVAQEADQAIIQVRDTGIGIPSAMLPRVFDMFSQVDRSLERSQGGLGIGLTLVKRLVEMHGGSVEAHSEGPGRGSVFSVRIPATSDGEPEAVANGDRESAAAAFRILIADDNDDAASSLAMLLRLLGHETRTAGDGLEAIEVAEAFRPNLILLDIGMPRMNGYDAARRIRERSWARDVTLVALTGWGQKEDRLRSQEAGFDAHLVKPVDPASLEKLLVEWRQIRTSTPRDVPPVAAPIART